MCFTHTFAPVNAGLPQSVLHLIPQLAVTIAVPFCLLLARQLR